MGVIFTVKAECLKSTKRGSIHYFHSGAVMSTAGSGPKIEIYFEMFKPGQDAVSEQKTIIVRVYD